MKEPTLSERVRAMRLPVTYSRRSDGMWSSYAMALLLLGVFAIVIWIAADNWMIDWDDPVTATVVSKVYQPDKSSSGVGTVVGSDGKVGTVFVSEDDPEKWLILVQTKSDSFSVKCKPADWTRIKEGDSIQVQIGRGHWSGKAREKRLVATPAIPSKSIK